MGENIKIICLSLFIAVLMGGISAVGFVSFIQPGFFPKVQETAKVVPPATSGFGLSDQIIPSPQTQSLVAGAAKIEPGIDIATRPDRKAILLTFQDLARVITIDYDISYVGSGKDRKVTGKITRSSSEPSISREIFLGSCSKDICTADPSVKTVTIAIVFTLEDGTTKRVEKTHVL